MGLIPQKKIVSNDGVWQHHDVWNARLFAHGRTYEAVGFGSEEEASRAFNELKQIHLGDIEDSKSFDFDELSKNWVPPIVEKEAEHILNVKLGCVCVHLTIFCDFINVESVLILMKL